MALKKPCPNWCPIKFSAGIVFIPAEILVKLRFTVVSWGVTYREAPKGVNYCYTATLENWCPVKFASGIVFIPGEILVKLRFTVVSLGV